MTIGPGGVAGTGGSVRKMLSLLEEKFFLGAKMALNIKDPATERSVRELAALTGEGVTTAVRKAAEERLQRVRRGGGPSLALELLKIGERCAALPDLDHRDPDDILGYDEHGLPR